jgi:spore coat polysaccharide biosynthesis protein SpsF
MKRVAIVQARMGSTRLPGKVLRPIAGQPMLGQQLRRLQACSSIDEVVVATSDQPEDDAIAQFTSSAGHRVHRGSADDVLKRMVDAAVGARADVVVRVTGDCPLIDPEVTARVVDDLVGHADTCDYASNVLRRTFPRGLDAEAMFIDTLQRLDRIATSGLEREHVTIAIRSGHPDLFLSRSVEDEFDNSDLRWTVDEPDDVRLLELLFERLDLASRVVPYREIIRAQRSDPELMAVNRAVQTWSPEMQAMASDRT